MMTVPLGAEALYGASPSETLVFTALHSNERLFPNITLWYS